MASKLHAFKASSLPQSYGRFTERLKLIPHQWTPARVSCVNPRVSVQPPDLASKQLRVHRAGRRDISTFFFFSTETELLKPLECGFSCQSYLLLSAVISCRWSCAWITYQPALITLLSVSAPDRNPIKAFTPIHALKDDTGVKEVRMKFLRLS